MVRAGEKSPRGKNWLYQPYLFKVTKKSYHGILGAQELTHLGSKSSLNPSMDPTATLNIELAN